MQMKHTTALSRCIIIALLAMSMVAGAATRLLSWGLVDIFTDAAHPAGGPDTAGTFDPGRDILYLPEISGRDIFEASRDLSICRNSAVRKHLYLYLTTKREYLLRAINRSYRYEAAIAEIIKNNSDLPEELWLLPLLESCFNPHAVSVSRAVGLWQFLENTSRPLGLKCDRWIDERRSVEKSTEAALRHLRTMRTIFPRWDLALAAYNGGAGYMQRTMNRTGVSDYWKLAEQKLIREETGDYVPKFIALMLIYKNQRLFGIQDDIIRPDTCATTTVELRRPADLHDVARFSGIPVQKLRELNPELATAKTPPFMKPYRLRVPADARDKIDENAEDLYKNGLGGVIEHRVKKGDTISKIARRYNKKTGPILRLNGIKNARTLKTGRILYIPN